MSEVEFGPFGVCGERGEGGGRSAHLVCVCVGGGGGRGREGGDQPICGGGGGAEIGPFARPFARRYV